MSKFLDATGLSQLWTKCKNTFATKSTATTSANGLMSSSDKTKLNGIATNANNYSLPTASSSTLGGVKSSTTGTTANRDYKVQVNSDGTMKVNVPWQIGAYSAAGTFQTTYNTYDTYKQITVNLGTTLSTTTYKVFCQQDGSDVVMCGTKVISKTKTSFVVIIENLKTVNVNSTVKFNYIVFI